jgi:hypothetical protein
MKMIVIMMVKMKMIKMTMKRKGHYLKGSGPKKGKI